MEFVSSKRIVSAEMELALSRYGSGAEHTGAPSEVLFDRLGFRPDGSRVYLDRGAREEVFPEIALPECASVLDLIRRVQHLRWKELGGRLRETGPEYYLDCVATLGIGHTSGQPRTALGLHENYLTFLPQERLAQELAAFFATRALLAGGGGLDPDHPFDEGHPRFILSPRSLVTTQLIAAETLGRRPFVKNSREHHCGSSKETPFHRMQVIGGDPLLTEVGMLLQFGTTLAMIRLAEARALPAALQHYDIDSFIDDLDGTNRLFHRHTLRGLSEPSMTALDCQFICLEACEALQESLFTSAEDRLILSYWREVLETLRDEGCFALQGLTDYGTKFPLLAEFFEEEEIPANADGAMHLFSLLLALTRLGGREEDSLASLFCPFTPETSLPHLRVVTPELRTASPSAPTDTRAAARTRLSHDTHVSVSLAELNGIANALFLNWDGLYQKSANLISPVALFPDPREPYETEVEGMLESLRAANPQLLRTLRA